MNFNKTQKAISLLYVISIFCLLIFLTPLKGTTNIRFKSSFAYFGNFFKTDSFIDAGKLLIELLVLTIVYIILLITFKDKKNSINN